MSHDDFFAELGIQREGEAADQRLPLRESKPLLKARLDRIQSDLEREQQREAGDEERRDDRQQQVDLEALPDDRDDGAAVVDVEERLLDERPARRRQHDRGQPPDHHDRGAGRDRDTTSLLLRAGGAAKGPAAPGSHDTPAPPPRAIGRHRRRPGGI